jgi:hypothetical protein
MCKFDCSCKSYRKEACSLRKMRVLRISDPMFAIWSSCEKVATAEMAETFHNNHELKDSRSDLLVLNLSRGTSIMKLTLWSWALLKRPPVLKPLNSFPEFYWTWRFITKFTRALQLSLAWARPIHTEPKAKLYSCIF